MIDNFNKIKKFQEHLLESGLARSTVAAAAPRMTLQSSVNGEISEENNLFSITIKDTEIVKASRDLFVSGYYSLAVQESFKALDKFISDKSNVSNSGSTLMDQSFSPSRPILFWSNRTNQSEKDEQTGYHFMYKGAMMGIRNPVTHEINWVTEAGRALELISLAQHLIRKAKEAQVAQVAP
jgi:uncharacterized protein (TIGR02391 family)